MKRRLRATDAIVPAVLVLWLLSVRRVDTAAMNDWGLLPALPVFFFVALGLLVVSIVLVLTNTPSPVRLGLHLVVLVLVLHGTMPMLFAEPIYSWTYKHVGVVNYINLHGSLDPRIDIYQNWPGFFAPAAWLTRIAGADGPLAYAAWAPVFFNLLICLELAFVTRSLPVGSRVRWLGMFIFVAGNWVGQDYFAPQSMAFVLSLAVFGMVLTWLRVDRLSAPMRLMRRLTQRMLRVSRDVRRPDVMTPKSPGPSRVAAFAAVFAVFAVVVVVHQLTPYMILLGVGMLTVAGLIRPRWFVGALAAITIGYLIPHLSFLGERESLFSLAAGPKALIDFLRDPLLYLEGRAGDSVGLPGRRITALAAPVLVLGLWGAGMLGAIRRLRAGRRTLVLCLLAIAPVLLAFGQSYGGEAVLRIYLFSLPWTALLAASVLEPRFRRWRAGAGVASGLALSVVIVLFMSASFGSAELHRIRPESIAASQAFYDHAEPNSRLLVGGPNFPTSVGGTYNEFGGPIVLTSFDQFKHRVLASEDADALTAFTRGVSPLYVALTADEQTWSEVFGLLPAGSLAGLDAALTASNDWQLVYKNKSASIFRYPVSAAALGEWSVAARPRAIPLGGWEAPVGVGIAGLALPSLALALARRRRIRSQLRVPVRLPITAVSAVAATPVQVPVWTLAHERRLTRAGSPSADPSMKTAHRAPRQSTHSVRPKQVYVSLLLGLVIGVIAFGANAMFSTHPSAPPLSATAVPGLVVEPIRRDVVQPSPKPTSQPASANRTRLETATSSSLRSLSSVTVQQGAFAYGAVSEGESKSTDHSTGRDARRRRARR